MIGTKGIQYVIGVSHLIYWLVTLHLVLLVTIYVVTVIKVWEAIIGIETAFRAGMNTM